FRAYGLRLGCWVYLGTSGSVSLLFFLLWYVSLGGPRQGFGGPRVDPNVLRTIFWLGVAFTALSLVAFLVQTILVRNVIVQNLLNGEDAVDPRGRRYAPEPIGHGGDVDGD